MEYHWLQTYMRKTSKGKLINKFECIMIWWSYLNLFFPKTLWKKYAEKLYLEYLLKSSGEKIEDMIFVIYLEYPFKNPGGES